MEAGTATPALSAPASVGRRRQRRRRTRWRRIRRRTQPVLHNTDFHGDGVADHGEATYNAAAPETTAAASCATREGHCDPTSSSVARPADHGASRGTGETVPDSVVPASGDQRHQRRRRLGRLARAAPTAPGEASTAAAACFPEPDPLVLEPCAGAGPPAWVDPMLEELTASLVATRPAGPTTPCCPTTPAGASLTTVSPPLSPELEMPQVTPPRMRQHSVADQAVVSAPTWVGHPSADNAAPPVSRAQSLLAQLEARLCIPLDTPLLSTPRLRKSKTPSMVVRRSGRLVAKTKASNPTLQAQNVLKQKLGIADSPQGPDPVALDSLKALFAAPLSPSGPSGALRSRLRSGCHGAEPHWLRGRRSLPV